MVRDGIEEGLNGHQVFLGERGAALKGSLGGCTPGLETGTPSRLTSPPATWARRSGGAGGGRPNLCYSGGVGSDKAYQHV